MLVFVLRTGFVVEPVTGLYVVIDGVALIVVGNLIGPKFIKRSVASPEQVTELSRVAVPGDYHKDMKSKNIADICQILNGNQEPNNFQWH